MNKMEDIYPDGCPKCGNKHSVRDDIDSFSPRSVDIIWYCPNCEFEWIEVYYFKEWYQKN